MELTSVEMFLSRLVRRLVLHIKHPKQPYLSLSIAMVTLRWHGTIVNLFQVKIFGIASNGGTRRKTKLRLSYTVHSHIQTRVAKYKGDRTGLNKEQAEFSAAQTTHTVNGMSSDETGSTKVNAM
ncbi:hypothetical protein CBL_05913 [Carabus blaptoides fortunei]